MNEKISVIIPVYKVEAYLDRCVQSIVEQTYKNLEIILVDDGSPDRCGAMCDAWAEKDSRIKVIHKKNSGPSDTRNAGLKIATGEWILFMDSDDVASVYLVESLLREPLEKDHISIASFSKFTGDPPEDADTYTCQYIQGNNWLAARKSYFCWGVLYNREIINQANLVFDSDLTILEDEGWNAVYLLFVRRICHVTQPLYYYRQNSASLTGGNIDHKRWIHAWQSVRNSVMKWFLINDPEGMYQKECRAFYRHCQNKMIHECSMGKVSYADYKAGSAEMTADVERLCLELFRAEHIISKYLPRIYYFSYVALMKLRNKLIA